MSRHSKTFVDTLRDEYGDDIALKSYKEGKIPAVSTGSLALDISIGIGGIPFGRFTEIFGPESVGKTTLALSIAKNALLEGHKILYVDSEHSLDYAYTQEIWGDYDINQATVIQPVIAEHAFEIVLSAIENNYKVILFDSVAASLPSKEDEEGMDKMQVGLSPRVIAKFLRKSAYKVKNNDVAMIFTNQVRDKIGSMFGGFSTPAGHALKHYTSLKISMIRGKSIDEGSGKDKEKIGHYINFTVLKNKVGIPYRNATTNVIYGKGIDYYRDILSFASLLGVIKNRSSYFAFEGETIGSKPGITNTIEALQAEPELLDKIVEMCYNVTGARKALKLASAETGEEENE